MPGWQRSGALNDAIWCDTCIQFAPVTEWVRKIYRARLVDGSQVVGHVSIYEHRACRVFTAVSLK